MDERNVGTMRVARGRYWSGSKLSKWIQLKYAGVVKPRALGLGEWKIWDATLKASHPFVFWLTEDCFDDMQRWINWPTDVLSELRYWGYNRFISQPHVLDTKLKKGTYYEIDTRMLHGLFETLVEFVEVEKAWMHVACDEDERKKYDIPWYKRVPYWLQLKEWRCPEAGLAYLEWEMSLTQDYEWLTAEEQATQADWKAPTSQALGAKAQYDLYNWWKNTRPARPTAMDAGGWSAYYDLMAKRHGGGLFEEKTDEERETSRIALDETSRIEAMYDTEDEEMLVRLIRIRKHLWT